MLAAGSLSALQATAVERIERTDATQPQVKVTDGALELTAPDPDATIRFEIYSITGQLVKAVELRAGTERLELPQGCYIVRTPGRSQKIVVK